MGTIYEMTKAERMTQPENGIQINMKTLQASKQIKMGLISPATEDIGTELAVDHTSEPIKRVEDIMRISRYLISRGRYRDNMLFIVGINFGLRVSDLRLLRFTSIIDDSCRFKDTFPVYEIKTRNTRKVKKNRYITINNAVIEAVTLYLENTPGVKLSDYMFRTEDRSMHGANSPITRGSIDRILKGIAKDLGLDMKMSTHTLRKTFAYHQMLVSNNDPRKLLLLQKILGHSSVAQTLDYIGITNEEIQDAYRELNLGSTNSFYLINGHIGERDVG